MPSPNIRSFDTKIEAEVLSVRFDGGYWIVVDLGAKAVISVEDRGVNPRGGSITYRNTWGLTMTEDFVLRAPRRLG